MVGKTKKTVHRTVLRLSHSMLKAIDSEQRKSGFNKKQRTAWLDAVLHEFLSVDNVAELIFEDYLVPGDNKQIGIGINGKMMERINQALSDVKKCTGVSKDVSSVIRAAITFKVVQSGINQ